MAAPEPEDLGPEDLRVGRSATFQRAITGDDVAAFAELSGDHNPLHLDPAYAGATNFQRPIVHGALQVSLASALAGMHLPGKQVVLGSIRSHFPAPLYYPCTVEVRGEVVSWFPSSASGVLRVRIVETASHALTAEVHLGFSLHEARAVATPERVTAPSGGSRDLVLVTGAGGAVGQAILAGLGDRFDLVPVMRRASPSAGPPPPEAILCDLEGEEWEEELSLALGTRPVFAVIHAAWPPAPRGGLLELDPSAIRRQLEFGGSTTVRLARWLSQRGARDGRLIVLGSTAATLRPELNLAAYSLGKAAMEHAVRLLAPELARKRITINAILPSYMSLGMNQSHTERTALLEAAKVPLGRLCTVDDVLASLGYLLSPASAFVTGQLFALTGGRL